MYKARQLIKKILLYLETEALSPRIKRPEREANHPPPFNTEIKNTWSYISTPLYVFMAWYLVKRRAILPLPLQHKTLQNLGFYSA
jgi:hypothetical protein